MRPEIQFGLQDFLRYICIVMKESLYIRIYKMVERSIDPPYEYICESITVRDYYEFYFTSVANCARWLGVSYNAVRLCLRGEYTLCKGYTIEYADEAPDERAYFIDPDKYRNPDLQFETGERYVDSAGKLSHRKTRQK